MESFLNVSLPLLSTGSELELLQDRNAQVSVISSEMTSVVDPLTYYLARITAGWRPLSSGKTKVMLVGQGRRGELVMFQHLPHIGVCIEGILLDWVLRIQEGIAVKNALLNQQL